MKSKNVFKFLTLAIVTTLFNCSDKSPKLVPRRTAEELAETFDEKVVFVPKVDILFVIDNSGSMGSYHKKMIANLNEFIDQLNNFPFLDFQIGVISSENYNGRRPILWGSPKFVTKLTPNYQAVLKKNIALLGTNSRDKERFLAPLVLALSPPLITRENAGFLRDNAVLAPIFVTDAADQSDILKDPREVLRKLSIIKKGRTDRIVAYGALIPSSLGLRPPNCSRDDWNTMPTRMEKLIQDTGGSFFDICLPDYGKKLTKIADDIVMKSGGFVKLSSQPIPGTIVVKYGGFEIENHSYRGWSFDPSRVGIRFGLGLKIPTAKLPPDPKLEINFKSAISTE